jgi:hypothetical protein
VGGGDEWSIFQRAIRSKLVGYHYWSIGVMEYWSSGKKRGLLDLIIRIYIKDAEE